MKKSLPYLAGGFLLLLLLLIAGRNHNDFDHRITLNKKDKIPYGTFVAYQGLAHLFPKAKITINKKEPGFWDAAVLKHDSDRQVMIIIAKDFNAADHELRELYHFVSKGNEVLISAYNLSKDARHFFHADLGFDDPGFPVSEDYPVLDTLQLQLSHPPFSDTADRYIYPGRKYNSWFDSFDTTMTFLMGSINQKKAGFIRLYAGAGSFLIHTAPLAFSNYFLLHGNNIDYYNQALSAMNVDATTVIWDEYFLHKPDNDNQEPPSPLRVLMAQPALRMALLVALAGLVIYLLLGVKRSQRMIPVIKPPKNDSLDFTKTIGRLYFQKKDNKDLCKKMSIYFSEYVHHRFKIPTRNMDEKFAALLSQKSGCDKDTILSIVHQIRSIRETPEPEDIKVAELYNLLDRFYKTI
ncbi:MAG: hypothetical protein M9933_04825 [Chitinophagaceae bacterium]|nr:hypothetical protein [Chitinophagaceae bacterium]